MQRMSSLFARTLREDPSDATIASHRLMVRGAYIRPLGAGIFSYLPLGWRTLRRIEQIVREEMDAIGCQELLMPVVHPSTLWERTGRFGSLGPELVRFKDRADRNMVLALTHEEIALDLAARLVGSYRQLPASVYHFQTKFRDEPRPRGGLLRTREFTMKDAYTFDPSPESLDATYRHFVRAYVRAFRRCGIEPLVVESDASAMGGSDADEFHAMTSAGEDTIVVCPSLRLWGQPGSGDHAAARARRRRAASHGEGRDPWAGDHHRRGRLSRIAGSPHAKGRLLLDWRPDSVCGHSRRSGGE